MVQVDPLEALEKPAHGGACSGLVDLIGNGRLASQQNGPAAALRLTARPCLAEHHDETKSHDALGLGDRDRRREKERIFKIRESRVRDSLGRRLSRSGAGQ